MSDASNVPRIPVHYPHGGRHYALLWRAHNTGAHLILARSQRALEHAARRVIDVHGGVTIDALWSLTIVRPSFDFCQTIQRKRREMERLRFGYAIVSYAQEYVREHDAMPPGLEACEDLVFNSLAYTASGCTSHDHCVNCWQGFVPIGQTLEEAFCARENAWKRSGQSLLADDDAYSALASRAPSIAIDAKRTQFFTSSNGVRKHDIAKNVYFTLDEIDHVLFFFEDAKKLSKKSIKKFVDIALTAQEQRKQEREARILASEQDRRKRRDDAFLALWNEGKPDDR